MMRAGLDPDRDLELDDPDLRFADKSFREDGLEADYDQFIMDLAVQSRSAITPRKGGKKPGNTKPATLDPRVHDRLAAMKAQVA